MCHFKYTNEYHSLICVVDNWYWNFTKLFLSVRWGSWKFIARLHTEQDFVVRWQVFELNGLTHWGRVTHICIGNLTIIGSDNGLSPGQCQAITWTNVGILLIGPLGTNLSEMLIEINTFSCKKIYLKMSSGKWLPFCLGLNMLRKGKYIEDIDI